MPTSHDIYKSISDQILDLMSSVGSDWTKCWSTPEIGLPTNVLTGQRYTGTNTILLGLKTHKMGYTSNRWATVKQWNLCGAKVRKGEKGTIGIFYKPMTFTETTEEEKVIPVVKHFYVFNQSQVEGLEPEEIAPVKDAPRNVDLDAFIENTGAIIQHSLYPHYAPEPDTIGMPDISAFHEPDEYYSTLLHELTHWTGHRKRLDRTSGMQSRFGDQHYAFEELVAEIGSVFASMQLGLTHSPKPESAKYLNNWIGVIKHDVRAFASASSKAQAAAEYLLAYVYRANGNVIPFSREHPVTGINI